MFARRSGAGIVLMAAMVAVGCSGESRPRLAKVHGTVTLKGKPLNSGRILFLSAGANKDAQAPPASGEIKADGTYELTTFDPGDGAVLGEHKVAVIALGAPGGKSSTLTMKSLVPKKYASPETSPLRRTVAAGDNPIDIDVGD